MYQRFSPRTRKATERLVFKCIEGTPTLLVVSDISLRSHLDFSTPPPKYNAQKKVLVEGETTQFCMSYMVNVIIPTVSNSKDVQYKCAVSVYRLELGVLLMFSESPRYWSPRGYHRLPGSGRCTYTE